MKKALLVSAAVLSFGTASAASAASFVASQGAPAYSGTFYDWNTGTRHSGDWSVASPPSVDGVYANPFGNTTAFGYVYPNQTGKFDVTGLKSLSFIWGSADPSNVLTLYNSGGTAIGSWSGQNDLLGDTSGSHTSLNGNPLVKLTFLDSEDASYLTFTTNQIAFEVASFAGVVPEPSTWALMILGFGLVGATMRRQKVQAKISFA